MRPRRALSVASAALLASTGMTGIGTGEAQEAGFHAYSYALENNTWGLASGLSAERRRPEFASVSPYGCSAPYSGNPIYQTQWIDFTGTGLNWLEIGSGHQCNEDYVYNFFGYGYQNEYYSVASNQVNPTNDLHTYAILRAGSGGYMWQYKIDGEVRQTTNAFYGQGGYQVKVGLESYYSPGQAGPVSHQLLKYAAAPPGTTNPYVDWDGRDFSSVDTAKGMCGRWVNDTQWREGQQTSCA